MSEQNRWTPWLVLAIIIILIGLRILYLSSTYERFNAAYFTRAFADAFMLGSLYALIALGYTLVYGIIRLINFAHGEVFMVGAFVTYFLFTLSPYPLLAAILLGIIIAYGFMRLLELSRDSLRDPLVWGLGLLVLLGSSYLLTTQSVNIVLAILFSMLITGVLGITIDQAAYKPLRTAPRNSTLITAIAVSFFLQNAGLLIFTKSTTPFQPQPINLNLSWFGFENPLILNPKASLIFEISGNTVRTNWLIAVIPIVTVILVVALILFVKRTRLGKAMRATAQDAEVAQMMGINVNKVIATTFLLGSILAAAGGALWGLRFGSLNQPAIMGILPGIKAFAAAVIGGIGSLWGAVIGGMIIGFSETFLTAIFPKIPKVFAGLTEFKDAFAFLLMILVLLIKPSGIVGEDLSEKV